MAPSAPSAAGPAAREPGTDPDGDEEGSGVQVSFTGISPSVLRPGDDLLVTGTVANTSQEDLSDTRIELWIQKHVPSATQLETWLDGTDEDAPMWRHALGEIEADIAPGERTSFRVKVPADESPLVPTSTWGPRGIEVRAVGEEATGSARSVLPFFPKTSPLETSGELSVVVPLTPTTGEWRRSVTDNTPVAEASSDRIEDILATLGPREVAIAADPALLDGASPLAAADDDSSTPTTTPRLSSLATSIAASARDRDVLALGYADADLGPLAGTAGEPLRQAGADYSGELMDEAGLHPLSGVYWPPEPLTAATAQDLGEAGAQAVLAASADTGVESAWASVETDAGTLTVPTSTDPLSELLLEPPDVQTRQELLALTATLIRAGDSGDVALLAALPRDTDPEGLANLEDSLDVLAEAPWLNVVNLRSLLGRTGPPATADLPAEPDGAGLDSSDVQLLADGAAQASLLAGCSADPRAFAADVLPGLLIPTSAAWDADPRARSELLEAARESSAELEQVIAIEKPSTVNLVSRAGDMPITLVNSAQVPITVNVDLVSSDPRLRSEETVEAELPADAATTVRVPVQALASANVTVAVHVLSPDGTDLTESLSYDVRMRADWEDIGTAIAAGLLAVLFVAGLARTIWRRRHPAAPDESEEGA